MILIIFSVWHIDSAPFGPTPQDTHFFPPYIIREKKTGNICNADNKHMANITQSWEIQRE